jgi:hypothetical protein
VGLRKQKQINYLEKLETKFTILVFVFLERSSAGVAEFP